MAGEYGNQPFVVVANRLPVDRCDGQWEPSPGGLVSAVAPVVRKNDGAWVGWTGTCEEEFRPFEFDGMSLAPINLGDEEFEEYYEGFSNATVWPLYHDLVSPPQFHRTWWNTYTAVNARFAQAAVEAAAYGATIWIHDFHLQLVPRMVRAQRPDVRIGFFNHIPFPPAEIFAQLPWRRSLLEGLLGADVIGFQRRSDVQNFSNAVTRLLDIDLEAAASAVDAYPISIDAHKISTVSRSAETSREARLIREDLDDPETLIIGVDRLDYTKGIVHRLRAYEELLEEGALDPQTTRLVQIAVPSREGILAYQELRDEVERLIGRINGRFGDWDGAVVRYFHHSYSFESTVALYLAADVLLVTSLRDGMNLVAKEYAAARRDHGGALVLSEFAGAADELDGALLVNPHDIDELKLAIRQAVTMPYSSARDRMNAMADVVDARDVHRWAQNFLNDLRAVDPPPPAPTAAP